MSFVDKVTITALAGKGGDGKLSFRHEKFIDKGGPDGGDGGKGGDVVLSAVRNRNTLSAFRHQKELKAEPGHAGERRRLQLLHADVPQPGAGIRSRLHHPSPAEDALPDDSREGSCACGCLAGTPLPRSTGRLGLLSTATSFADSHPRPPA